MKTIKKMISRFAAMATAQQHDPGYIISALRFAIWRQVLEFASCVKPVC
jgi:hypothetical protein